MVQKRSGATQRAWTLRRQGSATDLDQWLIDLTTFNARDKWSDSSEPTTSIPVFPLRMARHPSIFIRWDEPVQKPDNLKGRCVGLPEWAQTAAVYSRGFLVHQEGLDLACIESSGYKQA